MELLSSATITVERGLEGDHKGPKFPKRRITILAAEDWQAALDDLSNSAPQAVELPWTFRRANLLLEGLRLPRARGAILRVGVIELVVEAQLLPCGRMDNAQQGLRKALHPSWRGGVAYSVAQGGMISLGDDAVILHHPPERAAKLP